MAARMAPRIPKKPAHNFDFGFYARVSALSFGIGASMELFMIKTGFYEKVTSIEAERLRELKDNPSSSTWFPSTSPAAAPSGSKATGSRTAAQ